MDMLFTNSKLSSKRYNRVSKSTPVKVQKGHIVLGKGALQITTKK